MGTVRQVDFILPGEQPIKNILNFFAPLQRKLKQKTNQLSPVLLHANASV
jgi:hypothetical protein